MGIKETDHRFVGLALDEVSLVDHPANEEEWLTIKRLEAKEMTTENETNTVEETEPTNEATAVEKNETTDDTATEATAAEATAEETEKALNPIQAMALLKKIQDMLAAASSGGGKAPPFAKKTKKSLMGLTDDGELVINAELLADVQKARSFTGKRIGAIAEAAKAIIKLLNEVAPDEAKKLMEGSAPNANVVPAKKAIDPEPETEPETAKPDIAETVTDAVTKALDPLDERLKALEGSRGEPKSTDGDQTADITKNKDENIWGGRFN